MKHKLLIVACLALLVLAVGTSFARVAPSDTKYEQLPKYDGGYSFASETGTDYAMFDDWVCLDGLDITNVQWWGSYWVIPENKKPKVYSDTLAGAPSGGIDGFTINIYEGEGIGNGYMFAHPGALKATYNFAGNCNESFVTTVTKRDLTGAPLFTEDVFTYSANLKNTSLGSFQQTQGKTYWLSIIAQHDSPVKQWGWRETDQITGAPSVQEDGIGTKDFYNPCSLHDMSFKLTPEVPEPGSLLALGSGLTGLMGLVLKRRSK